MTSISQAHAAVNRHLARTYASSSDGLGLWVWPGYEPKDPSTGLGTGHKIPAKAGHIRNTVSDYERFTTFPEGSGDGRRVGDWFGEEHLWRWRFVGHVPALARVPLLALDCDDQSDAAVAINLALRSSRKDGERIPPIVRTGRGAHIYYRAPKEMTTGHIRTWMATTPRLQFRSSEGIVVFQAEVLFMKWIVLPPSIPPTRKTPYEWDGGWAETMYPLEEIPYAPGIITDSLQSYGRGQAKSRSAVATAEVSSARSEIALAASHEVRVGNVDRAMLIVMQPLIDAARRLDAPTELGQSYCDRILSWPPGTRHNSLQRLQWDLVGELNSRRGRLTTRDLVDIADAYISTQTSSGRSRHEAMIEWMNLMYMPAATLAVENDELRLIVKWNDTKQSQEQQEDDEMAMLLEDDETSH